MNAINIDTKQFIATKTLILPAYFVKCLKNQ